MDKLSIKEGLSVAIERARPIGKWKLQIERAGKIIHEEDVTNQVVDAGANYLLGAGFHADAQVTSWFVGLIDNASFSAFSNADTMGSHAGWIEFVGYSEANRVAWSMGSPAGRTITNGTAFQFTISVGGTLKGVLVTSNNTKSGTSGTLWSVAAFGSLQVVNISDLVKLVYTVSI